MTADDRLDGAGSGHEARRRARDLVGRAGVAGEPRAADRRQPPLRRRRTPSRHARNRTHVRTPAQRRDPTAAGACSVAAVTRSSHRASGSRPSAPTTATPSSTSTPGSPPRTTRRRSPTSRRRTPTPRRATAHLAPPARDALRRDQEPHPGDRPLGADPQGRLLVLHPHGRGPAVRHPVPDRRSRPGETAPPATGDGAPLPGEEVLLDGNALAEGHDFFALGTFDVSPDGHRLAYSTDFSRRRALHPAGSRTCAPARCCPTRCPTRSTARRGRPTARRCST